MSVKSKDGVYKVTSFETIDSEGRDVVLYGDITFSVQDDGRTLKVFLPVQ